MKTNRIAVNISLLLFIVLFIAGCKKDNSNPTQASGTSEDIKMAGMVFSPASKTVVVGTTVKWTNNDNVAHTVTSGTYPNSSGLFDSGSLSPGGTFSYKFNTVGSFPYHCTIHGASMSGTIIVESVSGGY